MAGIRDLNDLIKKMEPVHVLGSYVFAVVPEKTLWILGSAPLLVYRENEGITVIVTREIAEAHSLFFESVWGLISLTVHSDLESVGLLTAVTMALTLEGISTNVVSAFYHDHLFVPIERVSEAMTILRDLSKSKAG